MNYIERNRDFKGVWIPKEIWLTDKLTMLEKVILIEIDSLDNEEHCVAGNDYLAQFCQCSEWKVSTAIKKLQELGYIKIISFDGRHRVICSLLKSQKQTLENPNTDFGKSKDSLWENQTQTLENPNADFGKAKAININNNLGTNLDSSIAINNEETSSSTKAKTQSKKPSRKDELTAYITSLDYSAETKDILFKWLFSVGLPKGITVDILRDKLKQLWDSCTDEASVRDAINNSYINMWFGFFPQKTTASNYKGKTPSLSSEKAKPEDLCFDQVF